MPAQLDRSVGGLIAEATAVLRPVFGPDAEMEAWRMAGYLLNRRPGELFLCRDLPVSAALWERAEAALRRRVRYEPWAYIFGAAHFAGAEFLVDGRVLIPRPETEGLVDAAEAVCRSARHVTVLDMCTGSGCIGLSLARRREGVEVTLADIWEPALEVARANAQRLGINAVRYVKSNLFNDFEPGFRGYFDMILANPPYISTHEFGTLDPDLSFEPRLALDGGKDGLTLVRRLIEDAPAFLKKPGLLMTEIGYGQGPAVENLLRERGFEDIRVVKDVGGHDRIAKGTYRGSV